ncbi:hypothetical protein D2S45_04310 [Prevotella intermedia]|uniref:Uncharacterized protein n=1 Tax=Prevotella intermedia TaxID=28131 RepID=A0A3R7VX45_PREIN|nr:hypothetical protein D2S53_04075 [Prevotella intermedia]RRF87850.1 hypothetical protein D2S45_04310 [Prevotella intermedia]
MKIKRHNNRIHLYYKILLILQACIYSLPLQ